MTGSELDPMHLRGPSAWQRSLRASPGLEHEDALPGLLTYLKYEVGLDRAFTAMKLILPDFDDVRGCILLRGTGSYSPESFEQWWTALDGDVAAIEGLLNRVPLWDVFPESTDDPLADDALEELGRAMVIGWKAALASKFPGRRFRVQYQHDADGYGPTVSFHSAA